VLFDSGACEEIDSAPLTAALLARPLLAVAEGQAYFAGGDGRLLSVRVLPPMELVRKILGDGEWLPALALVLDTVEDKDAEYSNWVDASERAERGRALKASTLTRIQVLEGGEGGAPAADAAAAAAMAKLYDPAKWDALRRGPNPWTAAGKELGGDIERALRAYVANSMAASFGDMHWRTVAEVLWTFACPCGSGGRWSFCLGTFLTALRATRWAALASFLSSWSLTSCAAASPRCRRW